MAYEFPNSVTEMTSCIPRIIYSRIGHGHGIMRGGVYDEGFKEGNKALPFLGRGRQMGASVGRCNVIVAYENLSCVFECGCISWCHCLHFQSFSTIPIWHSYHTILYRRLGSNAVM